MTIGQHLQHIVSTIRNAASAAHVDIEHCVPRYPTRRKERFENEVVSDPEDGKTGRQEER